MSITHSIDDILNDSEIFPTEADRQRAKAGYLGAVLAAVLNKYKPQGGAIKVDVLKAARHSNVIIDAVDTSTALIIWSDIDPDAEPA